MEGREGRKYINLQVTDTPLLGKLSEAHEEVNQERESRNSAPNSEGQSQRTSCPAWKREEKSLKERDCGTQRMPNDGEVE